MPFPDWIAQGFKGIEDSKYYEDSQDDPSIKYMVDGGLTVTRRRFTRTPARLITTGYTDLSAADKVIIDSFWATLYGGGSNSFTYITPLTNETLTVRFDSVYKVKYAGMGYHFAWDVTDIKLRTI